MTAEGREGTPPITLKPKEAARMAAIGEDAEFGRILAIGKPTNVLWIVLIVFPIFGVLGGVGGLVFGAPPNRPMPTTDIVFFSSMIVGSILFGSLIWWLAHGRGSEMRFFAMGVTRWGKKKGDVLRLSYLDVASMTYTLTRQSVNGVYVGTAGSIRLETEKQSGKKGVKYQFRHREKAKGLVNRRFEGMDPMDLVRDAVAEVVSERMAAEVAEKGAVPWTGAATFTKEGLSVKKMLGGVNVVAYEAIDRMSARAGTVTLFKAGEKGGVVTLMTNSKNFWPGFVLLRTLLTPRNAGGNTDGSGVDPDEFEDED